MEPRRPPSSTEVERRLKADRGTAMAMATERRFSRFATSDRSLQTREIPEGGICLSAFLVISQTGHPERVLMGHLNPNGPWDHIGALDAERAEMNSKGWMLPSSHLMLGESPQGAAERILKEQLGLPSQALTGPHVFSEVYGAKNHWDLEFVFARGLVHVDEREIRPSRMLCDLISLAREHELEVPVVLGPIHLGEHVRSGEGLGGEAELFLEDPLGGPLRRFAQHQVRRREHPTLAVHLGPLGIEGSDVVPRSVRVEVAHEDSFRMTGLTDHQERGEANASPRDLSRLQGSVARGETGELPLGRHGHGSSSVGFQPSFDLGGRGGTERLHSRACDSARREDSSRPLTYAGRPWLETCTSSGPRDRGSPRWSSRSSCG